MLTSNDPTKVPIKTQDVVEYTDLGCPQRRPYDAGLETSGVKTPGKAGFQQVMGIDGIDL